MIFFTADLHFYHTNIIRHCNRPFQSAEEMNEVLVKNWNDVVKPTDSIYVLGDVSFGYADQTRDILLRLNGFKHLILGNHDLKGKHSKKGVPFPWESFFLSVAEFARISVGDVNYVLCHYPLASWPRKYINLHGHSHGKYRDVPGQLDVGVDVHDYRPISFLDAQALAKQPEVLLAKRMQDPGEAFQFLKNAGIITASGKLSPNYR